MSKVSIHTLTFLIFFSGCSDFKTILDMQTALDLEVGDCYIALRQIDIKPGEQIDLEFVDVVSCSEPHSHEIIANYPSVPAAYRDLEKPIEEVCRDATSTFVTSFHPNMDDSRTSEVLQKFDERFTYLMHFRQIIDSKEPDINDSINCAIMSRDSLSIGPFQKIIESF